MTEKQNKGLLAELADKLESGTAWIGITEGEKWEDITQKIIAVLRAEREPATEAVLDSKMADLLVDTTWRKCVGQCIADNCGRLFISRARFDEHVAPLIRALKGKRHG